MSVILTDRLYSRVLLDDGTLSEDFRPFPSCGLPINTLRCAHYGDEEDGADALAVKYTSEVGHALFAVDEHEWLDHHKTRREKQNRYEKTREKETEWLPAPAGLEARWTEDELANRDGWGDVLYLGVWRGNVWAAIVQMAGKVWTIGYLADDLNDEVDFRRVKP